MEKIPVAPWETFPLNYRLALVEDLLEDWPKMDAEDRKHVEFHNPDLVKAAGLWPGQPGDEELLRVLKEEKINPPAPVAPPTPSPHVPFHELSEDAQRALINSLRLQWPDMTPFFRELKMKENPGWVKAAGLWPEGRE